MNLTQNKKQNIVVEVMPRVGGHLPLPTIRLSKVQIKFGGQQHTITKYFSIYQLRT